MWFSGVFSAFIIVGLVALIMSTSFTSKEVLTLFGVNVDAVLQPYYQGMSLLNLATTLPTLKYETLGDVYQVTPLARDLVEKTINPVLEKELHFGYDWDEISTKPFKLPVKEREDGSVDPYEDLSTYIGRAIKEGVYLCDFFNSDLPALIDFFLYPKDEYGEFNYDDPYCLMDYINAGSEFFDNIINSIKVKDITGVTGIKIIDDENGIGNWGLNDFTNENVDTIPLSLLLDPESTNPLIVTLRDSWTVGDLKDESNFEGLLLSDVISITEDSPKILVKLVELGYTIGQLETTNLYTVLTIDDVFDVSDNKLLDALKDVYLIDLEDEDTILGLHLGDVLPTTSAGNTIIDKFADKTLSELSKMDINKIKLTEIFSEEEIKDEKNKILKALVESDPDITIGALKDASIIQSLEIGDILDDEQIQKNSIIKALADSGTKIGDIPSTINTLTIGELLDINVTDPKTSALLKKLAGYHTNELSTFVDDITIGDVMTDFSDYKTLDNDEVKNTKISNLNDVIAVLKTNLILSDIVDIDGESPLILQKLKGEKLTDLEETIKTLTLGDFVSISSSSPLILQKLAGFTLNDLEGGVKDLTLKDIVTIKEDSPQIIKSLKDVKIFDGSSLIERMNSLKLCDVYDGESLSGVFKYLWDDNNEGDILITDLPSAVNDLPVTKILEDHIYLDDDTKAKYYDAIDKKYYTYSELVDGLSPTGHEVTMYKRIHPIYWFLLTESDEKFDSNTKYYVLGKGNEYTINSGLEKLSVNFTYHMQSETLLELYDAGVIDNSAIKRTDLTDTFYLGQRLGDITMSNFLALCVNIIKTL